MLSSFVRSCVVQRTIGFHLVGGVHDLVKIQVDSGANSGRPARQEQTNFALARTTRSECLVESAYRQAAFQGSPVGSRPARSQSWFEALDTPASNVSKPRPCFQHFEASMKPTALFFLG